jgi:hypothetical protein
MLAVAGDTLPNSSGSSDRTIYRTIDRMGLKENEPRVAAIEEFRGRSEIWPIEIDVERFTPRPATPEELPIEPEGAQQAETQITINAVPERPKGWPQGVPWLPTLLGTLADG